MKIKRVKILSQFRGLPEGYEVCFNPSLEDKAHLEPICFVGLNGSGKSNVLEVVSEIFYYLETYHKADKKGLSSFRSDFGFEIEYYLPKFVFDMERVLWPELTDAWNNLEQPVLIKIVKKQKHLPDISAVLGQNEFHLRNNDNNRNAAILPARIIAYSSGMNELISNPFIKIDHHYYDEFEEKSGESKTSTLNMNRLFYMNYDSSKLITVCNFLFDLSDYGDVMHEYGGSSSFLNAAIPLEPLRRELKLEDLKSFSITLRLKSSSNIPIHLPSELHIAIDRLKKCASFCEESGSKTESGEYEISELYYWVNSETKQAFRHYFKTAYNLYRDLYFLQLLNLRLLPKNLRTSIKNAGVSTNISDLIPKYEEAKLLFSMNNISFIKETSKDRVYYKQLSDGEHQLLQVLGTILLMDTPGSLFILDEPETHFNPEWRAKFVSLLNKLLPKHKPKEQDIILTTHSPFIVSDCREDNVFIFRRDDSTGEPIWEPPGFNTFGASVNLITMKVFKKTATISGLSDDILKNIKNKLAGDEISNEQAINLANELGDSLEKTLLFDFINKRAS